jgi:hypothetical protein
MTLTTVGSIVAFGPVGTGPTTVQTAAQGQEVAPSYWTVEGMSTYEFSVGIFFFMLVGVVVFAAIMFRFLRSSGMGKGMKKGEKILFLWIAAGTAVAAGFGTLQLLYGRLF